MSSDATTVRKGDQRRITYEISTIRGVCDLNGMMRNTGVATTTITAATSPRSISQTSLRRELVHSDNRVRTSGMFLSSSPSYFSDHCEGPQHANRQKREQVNQQVPAAIAGRSRFDCR